MREQAQEEPQWFLFRTDVSVGGGPLSRTRLACRTSASALAPHAGWWLFVNSRTGLDRVDADVLYSRLIRPVNTFSFANDAYTPGSSQRRETGAFAEGGHEERPAQALVRSALLPENP